MRPLTARSVLLVLFFVGACPFVYSQDEKPADAPAKTVSGAATEQEVQQLREEIAALKAQIQQLAQAKAQASPDGARITPVSAVLRESTGNPAETDSPDSSLAAAKEKKTDTGLQAGWNGEHFYIKSSDGAFQIEPYGYVQTDYRAYSGDGSPPNTFVLRRARFGFQGKWGSHYAFALLADAAASSGAVIRDVYVTVKPYPELQFQAGQFKEAFAQEELIGVPNIDFVERGLPSLLYPSASGAFRSPGAMVFGIIHEGVVQYSVGAFNGKGITATNTTSEPEVIARLRFYPFKTTSNGWLKGLAFGGAIGHGRTRALSGETSFSGKLPDGAFTFFPSFKINGPVERYNGEFTWLKGPLAVRGEYDQLDQFRRSVGSDTTGGTAPGFATLPGVVAKAWEAGATFLLTGEARVENGVPKVNHPWLGPATPGGSGGHGLGAWEAKFRYEKIEAKALGASFPSSVTPTLIPTFAAHTDRFVTGLNWYPNYWIRYIFDFSVDRAKDSTVEGVPPQNFFVVMQRLQFRF